MDIWMASDFHISHQNLVRGVSEWEDKTQCRDFDTLEEHDQTVIDNINNVVKEGDILYCLGDFCMGGRDKIYEARKRLNVKTLHLILGNHDKHIENNSIIKTDKGYTNTRNLFTSVNQMIDKKIGGQNMILCHYSLRNWHRAHHGSWMLWGHSHGNLPEYMSKDGYFYKSKDVGIDTNIGFKPYHFEELKELFSSEKYINFNEDQHKMRL